MFNKIIFNISSAVTLIINEDIAALRRLFQMAHGKEIKMFKKIALMFVSIALVGAIGSLSAMGESSPKEPMQADKPQLQQQDEVRIERGPGRQPPDVDRPGRGDMPQDRPGGQRRPALRAEFDKSMEKLIQAYRDNDREKMGQAIRELNQARQRIPDRGAMGQGRRFRQPFQQGERRGGMAMRRGPAHRCCCCCACWARGRFGGPRPMMQQRRPRQGMGPTEGMRFDDFSRPRPDMDRRDWPRGRGPQRQWHRDMDRRDRGPGRDIERWDDDDRPMRDFRR